MPQYNYKCRNCGEIIVEFRLIKDRNLPAACTCKAPHGLHGVADRDFMAGQINVRGDYKKPILAQSMSFDTVDLAEHRKRYPDVEVQTDGRIATPVLKSLSQKRRYLLQRGWRDNNGYY